VSQDRREDADGRNQADLEFVVCCVVSVRNRIKRKEKEKKKKKGREKKGAREEGRKKKRRSDPPEVSQSASSTCFPSIFSVSVFVSFFNAAATHQERGRKCFFYCPN